MDILILCTGNICRSPVAEALLRAHLRQRGVDARVHSAGLLEGGNPAAPFSVEVAEPWGLDLSNHRSRTMTRELLLGADLVIGMAREHLREAAVFTPEAWPRTFTLKELVRRAEEIGPREDGEPFDEWLAAVHEGRSPRDLAGWSDEDDVADPIGKAKPVYELLMIELDGLVERFVSLGWGTSMASAQQPGPERPIRAGDPGPERPSRAGSTGPA